MKSEIFNKFLYFSPLISLICYIFISLLTSLSSFLSHSLIQLFFVFTFLTPFLPPSFSLSNFSLSLFQSVSLTFSVPLYLSLSLCLALFHNVDFFLFLTSTTIFNVSEEDSSFISRTSFLEYSLSKFR